MKTLTILVFLAIVSAFVCNQSLASEKPVQHLVLDDITSFEEAKSVFLSTTAQIEAKTTLNATELNDIHIITYSLEKAIAYFVENMSGGQQALADKMAVEVESIHLSSENNRAFDTKTHIDEYLKVSDEFVSQLKN